VMVDMQLEPRDQVGPSEHAFSRRAGVILRPGRQVGVVDEWFTVAALVAGDTDRRET
jgi:hypothetical protein